MSTVGALLPPPRAPKCPGLSPSGQQPSGSKRREHEGCTAGSPSRAGAGASRWGPELGCTLKAASGPRPPCPLVPLQHGRWAAGPPEAAPTCALWAQALLRVLLASARILARGLHRAAPGSLPRGSGPQLRVLGIAGGPRAAANKDWRAVAGGHRCGGLRTLPAARGQEVAGLGRSGTTEDGALEPGLRNPKPATARRGPGESAAPSQRSWGRRT